MNAPPPSLGVAAEPPPPRPETAPLAVGTTAPVLAPAPTPWPRSAQWASAALLLLALGLLGWHAWGALRWGSRPTEIAEAPASRIDLNRADRAQLLQLEGVGETTAARIEEYRRAHNGFRSVDELRKVRGIGASLLERIRPFVEVRPRETADDETDADQPPGRPAPAVRKEPAPKVDKAAAAPSAGKKGEPPAAPININTASAEELEQLPRIGPTLSARIIEARGRRPFESVDELRRVKGIGKTILEELRPFVKVDD